MQRFVCPLSIDLFCPHSCGFVLLSSPFFSSLPFHPIPQNIRAKAREERKRALQQKAQSQEQLEVELKKTQEELTKKTKQHQADLLKVESLEQDRRRLAALLDQYSVGSSSSSSSSSSSLSAIKKSDLSELKLLARGGSKAVYRCLYAKSPAAYYCFVDGESTLKEALKIKKEFEQEVAALTKPAFLQHPNILKVLAVRPFVHSVVVRCWLYLALFVGFILTSFPPFFADCLRRVGFRC
jgi:hypothetical protein